MSEDRMMNVDWEKMDDKPEHRNTFGEPVAHLEDLTRLEAEVERLTAELAERDGWVERCMGMAHVAGLFRGGRGEGDPVVGFMEVLRFNDELVAANDAAVVREVALRAIPDLLCGEEWEGAGVPVGGSVVAEVRRMMGDVR